MIEVGQIRKISGRNGKLETTHWLVLGFCPANPKYALLAGLDEAGNIRSTAKQACWRLEVLPVVGHRVDLKPAIEQGLAIV